MFNLAEKMHITYKITKTVILDYFVRHVYSIYGLQILLNKNIEKWNYIVNVSSDKILNMLTLSEETNE